MKILIFLTPSSCLVTLKISLKDSDKCIKNHKLLNDNDVANDSDKKL